MLTFISRALRQGLFIVVTAACTSTLMAQTVVPITWVGFSNSESRPWSSSEFWDPQVVPNNDALFIYDVTIDNNGNLGPSLESAVTISNLNVLNGAGFSANTGATGANLTVLGSTTLTPEIINTIPVYGGMEIRDSTYTLGNFNAMAGGGVFNGGYFRIERGGGDAILEFKNADIVENRASISLSGHAASPFGNAIIRDQDTLEDGLRNFAINAGGVELSDGHHLTTPGNFTNSGSITIYDTAFDNNTIRSTMTINGDLANTGSVALVGKGQMIVTGNVTNTGVFTFAENSKLAVNGSFTQESGSLSLGTSGDFETFRMTAERIDMAAGTTFGGRGTLLADLVEGGIFAPGSSAGRIDILGDLTFESTSSFLIEIGGLTPDTEFDQVRQFTQLGGSGVTLGGILDISFLNGFQNSISASDAFAILTSDQGLGGGFSNVTSGNRLLTSDGFGSFLVTYDGSQVVLSQFQIPEPSSATLLLMSGALVALMMRRRRAAVLPRTGA